MVCFVDLYLLEISLEILLIVWLCVCWTMYVCFGRVWQSALTMSVRLYSPKLFTKLGQILPRQDTQ